MAAVALATSPQPRKLRVGLFAASRQQPRWLVEAFCRVAAADFAEIVVIGTLGHAKPEAQPLLWKLYDGLDRKLFAASHPDERLELCRFIEAKATAKAMADAKSFAKLDLDVAFALDEFDDSALDGVARFGVWRLHADGVREVVQGAPVTGSSLQVRLAPGAEPKVAYQSWSRTCLFSVARNREQLLAKTAEFAWRALREAHRSGLAWLEQCPTLSNAAPASASARSFLPILGRIARRGLEKALHLEQWFLAFRFGDARSVPGEIGRAHV